MDYCGFCFVMWIFGPQRRHLQGWSLVLVAVIALHLHQGCRALDVWALGVESDQNVSTFSVPVVLLLTETGVAHEGASEGATAAPTSEHEDDNSLGYTGTAAAFPCHLKNPTTQICVLLVCYFA